MSENCTVRGYVPVVTSEVNDTTGEVIEVTVTEPVLVVVLLPAEFVAVRLTEYVPASVYSYVGFWSVEVPPSPKYQYQEVGEFSDVSVNTIARGAVPVVVFAENETTGTA